MIRGTRAGLKTMPSILISESVAQSLFGSDDPINRTLRMNNSADVTITGVYEDFPANTELNGIRFFAPWSLFLSENKWIEQRAMTDWRNHFFKIYVELPTHSYAEDGNTKVQTALKCY